MRKSNALLFVMLFVIATVCPATKAVSQTGTSSDNPQNSQSKQSRLDFIASLDRTDGVQTIARGQSAEEYVVISADSAFGYPLINLPSFIQTLRQHGFTKIVFSNGTTDILTADITSDGLKNIHSKSLPSSEALAVARAEAAEVAESQTASQASHYLWVNLFACQVSPEAGEYLEAKKILRQNDKVARQIGLLNDFISPTHEACTRVSRGLDEPTAIMKAELGTFHLTGQDIDLLNGRARAAGVKLTFSVCGNLDDMEGLCGTFEGEKNAQYLFAKSLFLDKDLSKQFAELGYTGLYIRNSSAQPNYELLLGMRPTVDGWVAFGAAAATQNTSSTQTVPSLNLTKVFSNTKISFPYPAGWQVFPNASDTQAMLAPPNSENNVKLSDGNDWSLTGIEYMSPADRIQGDLHGFSDYLLQNAYVKNDPRMNLDKPVESHVAGRPAIVVGYTTSSKVDERKEWGLYVFLNSNKGAVILHLYCPADDQPHGKEIFDAILGHVSVN